MRIESELKKNEWTRQELNEQFENEWEFQTGSLMLKTENDDKEWKKVIARHFFDQGFKFGADHKLSRIVDEHTPNT